MTDNYTEINGILIRKYRNILRQYIFIIDENGVKSKIRVGKMIYAKAELNTKWTIGHINGMLINIRPGFCENTDE
ncbi:MAG: hypothetical protein J6D27_09175 [Ruminiclostridium sp.]|nr:hypothetical protein [Ruminiclostridium sp.]